MTSQYLTQSQKLLDPDSAIGKLRSSHIPEDWSNDPQQLEGISGAPFREYNLDPPTSPILASDAATTPRRYLVSNFGHFYFWIPATSELLYVAECCNWKASCSASMKITSCKPSHSNHLLCTMISTRLHTSLSGFGKFLAAGHRICKSLKTSKK